MVLDNLAIAFPDKSAWSRRRIAARTFQNVAITVIELLWLGKTRHGEVWEFTSVTGLEHYHEIRNQGRGVIAVTAHLGNCDMLACSQALSGVPLNIVTKELSAEGLSAVWMERRIAAGVTLLPARGSILTIIRTLRKGEVLGLVVDQRTPRDQGGATLPFFGLPAWTTLAPHILAARTGAALLPVWSSRKPDGSHRVRIGPEISLETSAEETMTTINAMIENWIRSNPDQWLWLHRRWRS